MNLKISSVFNNYEKNCKTKSRMKSFKEDKRSSRTVTSRWVASQTWDKWVLAHPCAHFINQQFPKQYGVSTIWPCRNLAPQVKTLDQCGKTIATKDQHSTEAICSNQWAINQWKNGISSSYSEKSARKKSSVDSILNPLQRPWKSRMSGH